MAKKTRMGRNLNALLGGATRTRSSDTDESSESEANQKPVSDTQSVQGAVASSNLTTPASAETSPSVLRQPSNIAKPASGSEPETASPADRSSVLVEESEAAQEVASTGSAQKIGNTASAGNQADSHPTDKLRMLGVDQITRGTYQPRRHFDQELLQELADSIKAQGLIQPILVRAYGGKFELIAGERRWRASQLAGITDIPAIVRDMDDQSVAAVSLIENIQRADLNPLEEAQALERLCGEFSMTHQQVAEAVGRSRVAVTNLMRLLELHDDVKSMVDNGELDMGHARALLGAPLKEQPVIAKRITQQGLTVRAVEKLVKELREGKTSAASSESNKTDPNIDALGKKLGTLLGAPVAIKHQKSGSGKLEISYSSVAELEGILSHIK